MNRTSLWIVVVVAATWIGFLMGYAVSAHIGGAYLGVKFFNWWTERKMAREMAAFEL